MAAKDWSRQKVERLGLEVTRIQDQIGKEVATLQRALKMLDPELQPAAFREREAEARSAAGARLWPLRDRLSELHRELEEAARYWSPDVVRRRAPIALAPTDAIMFQQRLSAAGSGQIHEMFEDAVATGDLSRAVLAAEALKGRRDLAAETLREVESVLNRIPLGADRAESDRSIREAMVTVLRARQDVSAAMGHPFSVLDRLNLGHRIEALEQGRPIPQNEAFRSEASVANAP